MKAAITFIILVAITASVPVLGQDKTVLDVNGKPLRIGDPYYIKPVNSDDGVWLSFFRPSLDTPCPQYAVLSGSPLISPREPVAFFTESRQESGRYVYESNQLVVNFQRMEDVCQGQTGYWELGYRSDRSKGIVGTGQRNNDGNDFFKIKKSRGGYLITYSDRDIRVREYRLGEEYISYLEVGNTGNQFVVEFVPAYQRASNQMASNGTLDA
ncbi:hypothetical protein AALP_AA2G155000 [Arabis alpina]|uniref:Uncharacterized protein n=1 Tax=Arabis alpina TaxID=50452 RepID=A0A087HHP8_ARAAL|nr:hypothetical protein AALP_AA2G155000 [Arabis alpina]